MAIPVDLHGLKYSIENLKHNEMLDPLGQAWQNDSALAAKKPSRATVNKHRLCGSLLHTTVQFDNSEILHYFGVSIIFQVHSIQD